MMVNREMRLRFAPSPTGPINVGNAHTMLFKWLWWRSQEIPPYIAFFLKEEIDYSGRAVNKFLTPAMRPFLQQSTETMKTVEWSISSIEVTTRALIDELALKPREALLALRVAVSGGDVSPPLFESMYLVGRERTVARLARWR